MSDLGVVLAGELHRFKQIYESTRGIVERERAKGTRLTTCEQYRKAYLEMILLECSYVQMLMAHLREMPGQGEHPVRSSLVVHFSWFAFS